MEACNTKGSLLGLPCELRIRIYEYLLLSEIDDRLDRLKFRKGGSPSKTHPALFIRNSKVRGPKARSTFKVRSGRLRTACEDATYMCMNPPSNTEILHVNRQIHTEAADALYRSVTFNFGDSIEAVVPFISDLTGVSRRSIRRLEIVKGPSPFDNEFDRCEWTHMCRTIADSMYLSFLSLEIMNGVPIFGWDGYCIIGKDEFPAIVEKTDGMGWVNDLALIKGLTRINVRTCTTHVPVPMSASMKFWISFSASIAKGFAPYLRERLIAQST